MKKHLCIIISLMLLFVSSLCFADPSKVLVIVNVNSKDSISVANYYVSKRKIPNSNIFKVSCTTEETMTIKDFENKIRKPIANYLNKNNRKYKIDYIVVTKGIPLRYRDENVSWGLDNKLTLPFKSEDYRHPNPYFRANKPFSSKVYNMYLVTRLDAVTLEQAKALVDRSLAAKPLKGLFLIDTHPKRDFGGYKIVNDRMKLAAEILKSKGFEMKLESTEAFVGGKNLMGYYSWAKNDLNYDRNIYTSQLHFLPGSIAETGDSSSAATLRQYSPTDRKVSHITDLIRQGVTGVAGYVSEPYTYALAHADILFDRYTSGRNLAESFYSSFQYINWKGLVIGDPLCAPYKGK
ncbi:MAG: TIGR03790 family protein [Armatimonadota bacterium]